MYSEHETTGAIDLRSDTVTHPTESMRAAMAAQWGHELSEDPTVSSELAAPKMLGKQAAVFIPSSAGQPCSVLAAQWRGDEVVLQVMSHVAGAKRKCRCCCARWDFATRSGDTDGTLPLEPLSPRFLCRARLPARWGDRPGEHAQPLRELLPQEYLMEARQLADSYGLPLHLDGARIFNAAAYLRIPARISRSMLIPYSFASARV